MPELSTAKTPEVMIEAYLREKNLEFKVVNGQYNLVKGCPICGNPKPHHFYINQESGMWDCKRCQANGNWNQFRAHWGDDPTVLPEYTGERPKVEREYRTLDYQQARNYASALWSGLGDSAKYLDYLRVKRGLKDETLKHFKVGLDKRNISIPIFDASDMLVNIRYRIDPMDTERDDYRYITEKGCKSIMFNEKCLKDSPREIYLTEGEFDAMTLWQAGIKNVMSVTQGAGYWGKEWADTLKNVKRIYICYDNDEAGMKGALNAAEELGKDRCRIVQIPLPDGAKKYDVSDFFVGGGTADEFKKLANKAKMPTALGEDAIKQLYEYNEELRKKILEGDYKGVSTGYEKLDSIIGGYRRGRLIILSGLTSVGKTTFSENLILSMAQRQKSVMFVSMEMPPVDIARKFLMMYGRITGEQLDGIKTDTDPLMATVDKALAGIAGDGKPDEALPVYLLNEKGEVDLSTVLDVGRVAKEQYNAELLVIDHLQYFSTSTNNRASETANITRQIKKMAMLLDMPIILLAHLNRSGRQQQKRGLYVPTMSDLRDSGAVEQDADQVVFVCRDSESSDQDDKKKAVVKVAKNRDGRTGHVSFMFDLDIGYFVEMPGENYLEALEKKYGGSKGATEATNPSGTPLTF